MLAVMLLVMQAECNQNGRYKFCLSVKCCPCDLQSKTTGTHATFFESNQTYKLDLIHIFFPPKQLQMFLNLNIIAYLFTGIRIHIFSEMNSPSR